MEIDIITRKDLQEFEQEMLKEMREVPEGRVELRQLSAPSRLFSNIRSTAAYHKCVSDLVTYGRG